jgi:cytochrome c553
MRTRERWVVSAIFAFLVASLSVTLLTIGARSPVTHLNLTSGVVSDYDRTSQVLVGAPQPLQRGTMAPVHGDAAQQGAALFMNLACATCHGLKGQGGVFAPIIAGTNAATLKAKTNAGPGAMPRYEGLTEEDLNALAAFLLSVTKQPGSQ